MSYLIREINENDKKLIHDFNKELEDHGSNFRLSIPINKNLEQDNFISERKFILTENENSVRAGYTLKSQLFKINNNLAQVGCCYNPVTAGLFNKKYNICGVLLLHDAQKKKPDLFCLGMGGYSEPLPKLLRSLNWSFQTVPFFFKVCHPHLFLKNIQYLKKTKAKKFAVNVITYSGLGWFCIKVLFLLFTLFSIRFKKKQNIHLEKIVSFEENLDTVWENAKKHNSFAAVRNHKYLKTLYSNERFIKLKFMDNKKIVGWSISLCSQLQNHKQFGNMKLGSIVDCLSLKGYETNIIKMTTEVLMNKKADLIVSNQSHVFWKNAFRSSSFIKGPSNFIFASSNVLDNKIKEHPKSNDYMHLTRGDGDGPINL